LKSKRDDYVFISYASQDREYARELYDQLTGKRHRITCWMDVVDIPVGDAFFQEHIVNGIRGANALVLVESAGTSVSSYVERELAEAHAHGIPVFRYRVGGARGRDGSPDPGGVQSGEGIAAPAGKLTRLTSLLRGLRLAWLDLRIRFRITQPFWVANLLMAAVVVAIGLGIFTFSRMVTPLVVEAIDRRLPEAAEAPLPEEETPVPIEPVTAAPFHFAPDSFLLADDFAADGGLDESVYAYNLRPWYEPVSIQRKDGSLVFMIPNECSSDELFWSCEIELNTKRFKLAELQYFGLRARSPEKNPEREVSVSISITSGYRRRTGFGWAFASHATPFFRPNVTLPEEEFYAYIPLDDLWHTYEVVLDPQAGLLYYYMDGQLIGTVQMKHYEEWKDAPLLLLIYTTGQQVSQGQVKNLPDTRLEIDQVLVGGFLD
jgi:hypothetical protein